MERPISRDARQSGNDAPVESGRRQLNDFAAVGDFDDMTDGRNPLFLFSTMKKITAILLALAAFVGVNVHAQKFTGLALTPPMGWNSWNKFQCDVNEELIRQTADAMATNGMKDAGYQYVNIDDCWHGQRDAQGFMQPDAKRFPSGIKALADYVHAKGLKLGIYSDAGNKTC